MGWAVCQVIQALLPLPKHQVSSQVLPEPGQEGKAATLLWLQR